MNTAEHLFSKLSEKHWNPFGKSVRAGTSKRNFNNETKSYKIAVIYGEITAFGTPGETRTHYLALRRRTLYPGELRGHTQWDFTR